MPDTVQVYEYGVLKVDGTTFTEKHYDTLVRESERLKWRYFRPGYHALHFSGYVGVIQVGKLIIEVLPKTDGADDQDAGKWRNALIQMLRRSGLVNMAASTEASLKIRRSPLIEIYLERFLDECDLLSHAGLTKKYCQREGNLLKVKGRIIFSKQISQNLLHKERMYTAHQVYDRDNVHNRILRRALSIVAALPASPRLSERAGRMALMFEGIEDQRITHETFKRIAYDRNTERYRMAHQLAKLIILNYSPDMRGGRDHVLAMMFEMNELFEKYVLRQMLAAKSAMERRDLQISGQVRRNFWDGRGVKPDILVTRDDDLSRRAVVLDTKWKIPSNNRPDDNDLKQIFVYNLQFKSARGLLVYPRSNADQESYQRSYEPSLALPDGYTHACEIYFLELFDEQGVLRNDVGHELLKRVEEVK